MDFDAVAFSGGGSRCFWQAGFYAELESGHGLRPTRLAGVSGGAAMACTAVAGRLHFGLQYFKRSTAANRRNFYPVRLLSRNRRAFPHVDIYRDALLAIITDEAFAAIARGPEIQVLLARPRRGLDARLAGLVAQLAFITEKRLVGPVHAQLAQRLGVVTPEIVRVQSCRDRTELAELILHSSSTPPFTPLFLRDGRPVLDGGAVDPVPTVALGSAARRSLVLLTNRYDPARLPRVPGRTYAQPSVQIPIGKFDYTSPDLLQHAFDLGIRDAQEFAHRHRQ